MLLTKKYINELSYKIVGAAIAVHKELGPGLLEKIYEECLIYELRLRGMEVKFQQEVPVIYRGKVMKTYYRYDILVEDYIIVELKAVEYMKPVFTAQTLSHINLLQKPKALLFNFNCLNLYKEGTISLVNKYYEELPDS